MMQRLLTSSLSSSWQNKISCYIKALFAWLGELWWILFTQEGGQTVHTLPGRKISIHSSDLFLLFISFYESLYVVISRYCHPDRQTTKYFLTVTVNHFVVEHYVFRDWYFHTTCNKTIGVKKQVKGNRPIQEKSQVSSYYFFFKTKQVLQ